MRFVKLKSPAPVDYPLPSAWDSACTFHGRVIAARNRRARKLFFFWTAVGLVLACLALYTLPASAGPLDETRYCGAPKRDANGVIVRSSAVTAAFQRLHPCPSTNLKTGACPRWQKDHVLPLVNGGCDAVANMQWLPVEIKTCAGVFCKDRWERAVYAL